jgi:hypothetical protein
MILSVMTIPAYASHGTGGYSWTSSSQEFYCESSLSNLSLTAAVDPACDVIEDAAADWTNLSDPSWSLTKSTSSAINQKGVSMGTNGDWGEMVPSQIFGIMYSAYVKYNTDKDFGDVDVDSGVGDFITTAIHELGHLPTLFHNGHGESNSVMKAGLSVDEKRRTITSNDEAAVEAKYP